MKHQHQCLQPARMACCAARKRRHVLSDVLSGRRPVLTEPRSFASAFPLRAGPLVVVLWVAALVFGCPVDLNAQTSSFFQQHLSQQPGSIVIALQLVDALTREGNLDPAISILDELIARGGQTQLLLLKRAGLQLMNGRPLKAKEDYENVLGESDAPIDAWYGAVSVSERLLDFDRSLALCERLLKQNAVNSFAILHAGWACYNLKRYDEALGWYSRPEYAMARDMRLGRAWTHMKQQTWKKAIAEFRSLLVAFPGDLEAMAGLREAEYRQLNGVVKDQPTAEVLPRLREQGRYLEALQLADALLTQQPDLLGVLAEKALLLSLTGRLKEAEEAYTILIQKRAQMSDRRGRMSVLWSLGRLSEAAKEAREIVQKEPTDVTAVKIIADDLYAMGRFEQALGWYEKLPEDLWAWLGQGWCHLIAGRNARAEELFRKCLFAYPGNPSAIEGLRRAGESSADPKIGR